MEVDAGLENVGVAGEPHRGEITAIGAAPDADLRRVDVGQRLQVLRSGDDVLIFGPSRGTRMIGMMEAVAVADTEAVVYGQYHIAVTREILVHRVGVAVIIHVLPAEQHLPRRAAMDEG